jgi:hypothetical protein
MTMRYLVPLALLAALAACDRGAPSPEPTAGGTTPAAVAATPAAATPSAPAGTGLDTGALSERQNPDRLLAYLAEAIGAGRWGDAARAWQDGTDGAGVKQLFGAPGAALVTFGKGEEEGAAGSLYYEAPVLLLANGGKSQKQGVITLRRVNDVPGASEASLAWHVERIEWKE